MPPRVPSRGGRFGSGIDVDYQGPIIEDPGHVVPITVIYTPLAGVVYLAGAGPYMPADLTRIDRAGCSNREAPVFVAVERGDKLISRRRRANPRGNSQPCEICDIVVMKVLDRHIVAPAAGVERRATFPAGERPCCICSYQDPVVPVAGNVSG